MIAKYAIMCNILQKSGNKSKRNFDNYFPILTHNQEQKKSLKINILLLQ